MYRNLTKLLLAGVVAALCAVNGTPAAFAQEVSGCLDSGKLKKIALGGEPASPCTGSQVSVTLGATGTTGAPGATGATGADGADGAGGDPAGEFQLFADLPLTDGLIVDSEWNECANDHGGRPANTLDVLTLPWDPTSPVFVGWVHPYIVAIDPGGGVVDVTGIVADRGDMTCSINVTPWNGTAGTGIAAFRSNAALFLCITTLAKVCVIPKPPPGP